MGTWPTLAVLLAGVVVVIGGILALRLHAFLALVLGALVVGMLTPASAVRRYAVRQAGISVLESDSEANRYVLGMSPDRGVAPGTRLLLVRPHPETGVYQVAADLQIERFIARADDEGTTRKRAVARIIDGGPARIEESDVVIHPLRYESAQEMAGQNVGSRVAAGFGETCVEIGILIAMAAIIGKCLLDSGAADRVVRSALKLLGEGGAPLSFLSSGFLLGIPVFFDTVFYLLIPLGKAMRMRTGRNYLVYVLTIVSGATMAHSLVPPTPGPLFVAGELGVDIGVMILAGCVVGLFTAGFGYLYALVSGRLWELPLRAAPDLSLDDLEAITRRDESELPPLWLALLPILLPVILIGGNTIVQSLSDGLPVWFVDGAATLGDKNIALVIAAAIALVMLGWQKRADLGELATAVQSALAGGGVIILITAAGGAFGTVLQQTGVSTLIADLPDASPIVILILAFLITTAIRTAQGSATVAMITAVGVLAGIAGELPFHTVYLALAIGCGSKPIAWMNDSGFWVITKMSGMTELEGLKYVTPMTTCMGLVGLGVLLIGVTLFPLA